MGSTSSAKPAAPQGDLGRISAVSRGEFCLLAGIILKSMEPSNKRRFARKKIDFAVQVLQVTRSGQDLPAMLKHDFIGKDISAGGMGLLTNALLLQGDRITVRFKLPGETRVLKLTAQIRRMTTAPGLQVGFIANLKFEGISVEDATYLTNYIGTTFLMI